MNRFCLDLCTEAGNPLKVGAMSYDAVIIPGCETLRSTTIERLKTFARAGGKLILMGEAPTMTDAVPSNDGAELAALSSQIVFEKAALLEAVEPYRTLRLENETGSLTNHYIYQLRIDQDCSWLFIAVGEPAGNPDFVKKDPVNIVLNGRFTVKEYDTMTGRIRDVKTAKRGAQTVVNHIFYNQSSLLLKLMPVGETSGSVQAAACERCNTSNWRAWRDTGGIWRIQHGRKLRGMRRFCFSCSPPGTAPCVRRSAESPSESCCCYFK